MTPSQVLTLAAKRAVEAGLITRDEIAKLSGGKTTQYFRVIEALEKPIVERPKRDGRYLNGWL